ncbi:hypothetical protein PAAG_07303 [Paracoccidioides lutzii Pb01]|uniref:Myb-like domain-containing protein n=1 Tax=Paracoccidioides lutzii (strain ATCC MYA-826 / Pb01) TaxID=502779 RepID=C1H962_PARBA|nr:hypothetical protein PAAG_07303 [Paracoccidioides lutzii Pb01]EEH36885.2 hypothetical protein PAAG_07303 [Paracoccidioides lutzii Pb01]
MQLQLQQRERGVNKRRRDIYEDDSDSSSSGGREGKVAREGYMFSTPKRRRRAPAELPLGLVRADFQSLESPGAPRLPSPHSSADVPVSVSVSRDGEGGVIGHHVLRSESCDGKVDAGDGGHDSNTTSSDPQSDWTSEDDRKLVELVLEKLKLSKRDWSECARRMGKDNDSVGRRWRALVGEGNVGLRRGRNIVRNRIHENWRGGT